MDAPAATPHIYAGVSSILKDVHEQRPHPKVIVPALIVVLFVMVTTRLSGSATNPTEYRKVRQQSCAVVKESLAKIRGDLIAWDENDVDDCMGQLRELHWTDMDWFRNIQLGSGLDGSDAGSSEAEKEFETMEEEADPIQWGAPSLLDLTTEDFLQPGLGTMMDERLDFLSDAKNASVERWRAKMIRRIAELERTESVDPT